jgi:hypothetical protein
MKNNHFYFHICLFEDTRVGFIGVIDNDIRIAESILNIRIGVLGNLWLMKL